MRHILVAAGVGAAALVAVPLAPANAAEDATVSVLHAVPGITVDVYANGEELIPNFKPGTLSEPLTVPAGTYDLEVFADGDDPDTAKPAIEANDVKVPSGANATVVAHLGAEGKPQLTAYANDTAPTKAGDGRLTVRHTAAAPAVDVRADGKVLFDNLANPDEASADVPAGTYSADVALAGTDNVALGPADVPVKEGTHTIVYAWGSAEDGNLDLAVQTIDGLHSAPAGVPGGEAGLAPESGGLPAWTLGLGGLGVMSALAFAARRAVPARVRRRD
jgi:hypothetical protein